MHPLYLLLWIGGAVSFLHKPAKTSWRVIALGAALIGLGVACCQLSLPTLAEPKGAILSWIGGDALILAGFMLALPHLYSAPSTDGPLARLGTFLASFSYSLYLTHAPVLGLQPFKEADTVNAIGFLRYAMVIVLCLVIAFVFSRCFETVGPTLKAKVRAFDAKLMEKKWR